MNYTTREEFLRARDEAEAKVKAGEHRARVILFRASGKYYTEETWRTPVDAIGPFDLQRSPDFRRISDGGAVLVCTQEPWGYPHLFPAVAVLEP